VAETKINKSTELLVAYADSSVGVGF